MSESVVYMRGNLPFQFERLVSAEIVADAKHSLVIDPEALRALAEDLARAPGFLDRQAVKAIASQYLPDEQQAEAIARLITGLEPRVRSLSTGVAGLLAALREWQKSDENRPPATLTEADLEGFEERLPLLLQSYPGLKRQSKAKHLVSALGNPVESIELICDVRPVFDEERSGIDGMIPLTTLKVVCTGADGLPIRLEAILPERAVASLAKKATAATQKLKRIRETLQSKALPIPVLDMTRSED